MASYNDMSLLELSDEIDRRGLDIPGTHFTKDEYIQILQDDDNNALDLGPIQTLTIPQLQEVFDQEGIPTSELKTKGDYYSRLRQAEQVAVQTETEVHRELIYTPEMLAPLELIDLQDIAADRGLPASQDRRVLIQEILQDVQRKIPPANARQVTSSTYPIGPPEYPAPTNVRQVTSPSTYLVPTNVQQRQYQPTPQGRYQSNILSVPNPQSVKYTQRDLQSQSLPRLRDIAVSKNIYLPRSTPKDVLIQSIIAA